MQATIERLEQLIADLVALKSFLLKHQNIGGNENLYIPKTHLSIWVYGKDRRVFSNLVRSLCSGGKKLEKEYTDYSVSVSREIGTGMVELSVSTGREAVCERVVTGTKIVPAVTIPERTEETYEWKCK